MSVDKFPWVIRSVFAAESFSPVLAEAYGLTITRCRLIKALVNDVYEINTSQGEFILRVYSKHPRPIAQIQAELELLLYLRQKGIGVSFPIAQKNGAYSLPLHAPEGERQGVLFSNAPGTPLHRVQDAGVIRQFGQFSARLHLALNEFNSLARLPVLNVHTLLDSPLDELEKVYDHRPEVLHQLRQIAQDIRPRLEILGDQSPEFGLCHGDLNRSNAHIDETGQITLFDFEYCGPSWRMYDVASMTNTESEENASAFMEGYTSVRPFTQKEQVALPAFEIAQKIWMLGTGARHSNLFGMGWMTNRFLDMTLDFIKQKQSQLSKISE